VEDRAAAGRNESRNNDFSAMNLVDVVDSARAVGLRKSPTPVVLCVAAAAADAAGVSFYEGNERVWLADCVPSRFIEVAE
jgi:putative RNA 2'-phosphotransferase